MAAHDVIVLNSHGVGQYAYCDHMPTWGETLAVKNWHVAEDGGKGSNVSVALGRLGLDCAYVGKVGNDPWGDLGEKWMEDAGVDCTYLLRTDEVSTGTGLILVGPDGQNAIIDGDSSSLALTEEEVVGAISDMAGTRYFITGFEVPIAIALAGARAAHKLGMVTCLNPSPLPDTGVEDLSFIDYLFINEVEGRYLAGIDQDAPIDVEQLTRAVKCLHGSASVIMTLGSEGSCAVDQDGTFIHVAPYQVEKVVNTAGAGDGFMAATVAQLSSRMSLKQAMAWASGYAALCVTIDGTIPAYRPRAEVEAFIASHPHA